VRRGRTTTSIAALAAASALVLAACGGSSDGGSTGDATSPDASPTGSSVKFDVGVTEEACPEAINPDNGCIYLGVLSDLTEGPFAPLAVEVTKGQEDFWKTVNEAGGIGGFDINIAQNTRDNKYDPAVHSQEYRSIEPNILALAQTLGTPQTQAILPDMEADNVIGAPASWWSGWQFPSDDGDLILESGASYCIQAMSGMDWYVETNGEIGKIVAVGPPGDFGGDFAAGAQAWAEANGVEWGGFIESLPNAIAGNQDAAVAQIVASEADVVALGTGPGEVAEIVGKAAASGFGGKFVGAAPTWNPALLQSAAAPALLALFTNFGTTASFGTVDTEAMTAMEAQVGAGATPANDGYTYGWVWQYPLKAAIEKAAASGDLTREGLRAAVTGGIEVDYQGAQPNALVGGPPDTVDRSVTINVPDEASPLGIKTIVNGYVGATAEAYDYSKPCAGS
jgi:ABC-type branched-subunit amino acid transport system substrate-binding protein